jgi:hypothetical protein
MAKRRKVMETKSNKLAWFVLGTLGGVFLIGLLMWGLPQYGRYQRVQHAKNEIAVNHMKIGQTKQLVEIQKQKAQITIEEAKGIAEAQRLINNTLTPLYLQHEAIQSQETQSNKIIYVPSGNQGIPMVQTVNP